MSKEIKQKADELVDLFVDLKLKDNNDIYIIPYPEDAIIVAIKHQERLIEELESLFLDNMIDVNNDSEIRIYKKRQEQKEILTELKSRL